LDYAQNLKACPMNKKLLFTFLFFSLLGGVAWGQARQISGKVTAKEDGNGGVPGVNIVVQGTTKGTTTDANGNYALQLEPSETTLVFTFVGYLSVTQQVGARTTIDVTLESDLTTLEEVVVVGYGTQREKDRTSAIVTLKSEDIMKTQSGQAMQSLQGKVPGLQVVSSGAPGDSPTIRIRGIGSYPNNGDSGLNNESPLYVVDGMFFDNIDFLNPADIASISVLKDASSSAIYGVRASNGVIIVTTKSGSHNQRAQISYEGYTGTQVAQNVLKMANAEEFTNMANESGSVPSANYVLNSMQRYGRSRVNPNVPEANTDWYKQILQPAAIQNHNLSVSGGDKRAKYSIGVNYFSQEGILKMKNDYERFNLRTKIDYTVNDWLTIGGNVVVSNATKYIQDESAWSQAYYAVPIMPVYDELNQAATPIKLANAQNIGYRDGQNPFASLDFSNNVQKIRKILANFYIKADIIPNKLSFQTTYNSGFTFLDERRVGLPFFIGDSFNRKKGTVNKKTESFVNQIWDNVLTYNQNFGNHNLVAMGGASFRDESYSTLRVGGIGLVDVREQNWYVAKTELISSDRDNVVGDDGRRQYGLSYFGRVAYDFHQKYLLYATMRADGTSKYQEKWGYFPAVGAGWVISEESFLKGNPIVDFLKLRAGWGRLGNDKIQASSGANTSSLVTTSINGVLTGGTINTNTFNHLQWELVEETNFGITAKLFKNRLSIDADYFVRDTKKAAILIKAPVTGEEYLRNAGGIRNKGLELALNWSDNLPNGLTYRIGANMTTLKNEVTDLYTQPYINGGTAEFLQRSIVGSPLLAFYGYEVAGVYQNNEQVLKDPTAVFENAIAPGRIIPGDFKYKDQNGDGKIDGDDRVVLGTYLPSVTYGANLGVSYKNFDFSANIVGQMGNKILNRKRGQVIFTADANVDADLAVNRWHGEGTSDKYPSSAGLRKSWNQKMSNFFVEDGSFFRIQNVQLAYNIKNKKVLGVSMPESRISITAERPLTVFNYNGFNPEVANGFDTQTYPIPAVYTIGLNVKF
jgi:TonB-dependent starch-binding outer membrane protein SusC